MILNILHQAVITHSGGYIYFQLHDGIDMLIIVYTYTITDWGNTEQLQIVTW